MRSTPRVRNNIFLLSALVSIFCSVNWTVNEAVAGTGPIRSCLDLFSNANSESAKSDKPFASAMDDDRTAKRVPYIGLALSRSPKGNAILEPWIDTMSKELGHTVIHYFHFRAFDLLKNAPVVKAQSVLDTPPEYVMSNVEHAIEEALFRDPGKKIVVFNLEDMSEASVRKKGPGYTNSELRLILNTPEFLRATLFFRGTKQVDTSEVLREFDFLIEYDAVRSPSENRGLLVREIARTKDIARLKDFVDANGDQYSLKLALQALSRFPPSLQAKQIMEEIVARADSTTVNFLRESRPGTNLISLIRDRPDALVKLVEKLRPDALSWAIYEIFSRGTVDANNLYKVVDKIIEIADPSLHPDLASAAFSGNVGENLQNSMRRLISKTDDVGRRSLASLAFNVSPEMLDFYLDHAELNDVRYFILRILPGFPKNKVTLQRLNTIVRRGNLQILSDLAGNSYWYGWDRFPKAYYDIRKAISIEDAEERSAFINKKFPPQLSR